MKKETVTVTVAKYKKLQVISDVQKTAIDELLAGMAEKENKIAILENVIYQKELNQKQLLENVRIETNKYVEQALVDTNIIKQELAYTKDILINNFDVISALQNNMNFQNETANKVLNAYKDSIFKVEKEQDNG